MTNVKNATISMEKNYNLAVAYAKLFSLESWTSYDTRKQSIRKINKYVHTVGRITVELIVSRGTNAAAQNYYKLMRY